MNTHNFTMNKHIAVAILATALAACGAPDDGDEVSPEPAQSERLDHGARVLRVDFASPRSKRLSVSERVQHAGRVLLGGAAETAVVEELQEPEGRGESAARSPSVRQTLRVTHVRETDDLLMINGPVADDHSEGVDIGEAAARRVFEDTVARLAREGLDDVNGLDLARVKVSRLRQGSAQVGHPETLRSHVKAYVFSAPRMVNGLEVLHSNVTIGVHRSGKLASIHSRGVLPGAVLASPALAAPRDRIQSSAEIHKRAQVEFPDASVQSQGLVYVVDAQTDEESAKAVEPREVFVVFPRLHDGPGYGRGRAVSYSVTDASAPAAYLDTQLQNDPGDVRR